MQTIKYDVRIRILSKVNNHKQKSYIRQSMHIDL